MREIPSSYELISKTGLGDLHAVGYVLRHRKSGANIALVENDDDNKVFYVGFRTPPKDSTGVPHIIEHSVLCGSKKYPTKDPFVELVKGSLNTFLNAMTYPDKTVYPVASCNDKDFDNLIDVYMDAVLHPNIYEREEIFRQEGWHYEMESEDDELTINGVVYNEMKGAFSSPDDVLNREIMNSLFPDTPYGVESGGDPKNIPDLTYEQFLEFHKTYYHPCNSYIYLYGNMDFVEKLEYLDREYLSKYSRIDVESEIPMQKAFSKPAEIYKKYPIASDDDGEDGTYLSLNYVVGDALDAELYQAFDIVDYALLSAPGAPLHQALIDAGIGKDILGGYDSGTLQPVFSVIAKGANESDKERFLEIIHTTLEQQVKNGLDKKALLAGINSAQFRYREGDFGSFPKGLIYGLQCLDSWIYNDAQPFMHMHATEVLDRLRDKVESGYFEEIVEKYLLNNTHASIVIVTPEQGLTSKEDEQLRQRLAQYKDTLTKWEIADIVEGTKHLKEYQETPSTPEELATIPMLTREDLSRKVRPYYTDEYEIADTKVLHHNINTNGIHYLNLVFDIGHISEKDYSKLSFLVRILGLLDTEQYAYADFANEVNLYTGGLSVSQQLYSKLEGGWINTIEVRGKFLFDMADKAIPLMEQMAFHTTLTDTKRIHELLNQEISRMQQRLQSAGSAVAALRSSSYFSEVALINEMFTGIAYYDFLKDFEEHFDAQVDSFRSDAARLLNAIFRKENLLVSSIGPKESLEQVRTYLADICNELFVGDYERTAPELVPTRKNEGFMTAGQVQFVARSGNFKEAGYDYHGAMKILKVILSYDYLWINVRVKGGAYGCSSEFGRHGNFYLVSYRDPNLSETNEIFEKTPEYIANFDADERDMTKYIIGTISGMDTPLTPSQNGLRSLGAYMTGVPIELLEKERNQVIDATVEDIRALAPAVEKALEQNYICVVGNEDAIQKNKELFQTTAPLI
ncbi:hypothetical protein SAMN02910301_0055 [Lachnospiraceae bacterium XBD2001]|nr:hypothetical protein SAMN02910301_0055 [Lachnospiraceae bacterium XBD2001]